MSTLPKSSERVYFHVLQIWIPRESATGCEVRCQ